MMTIFPTLLGSFLVIGALGAPTSKSNCSEADNYLGLSCGMRAIDFGEKLQHLDVEDKSEMREFKRSCDALNSCTQTLGHCPAFQDEEVKTGFASIKSTCALINFVDNKFKDCDKKLDDAGKEKECYDEWDPFTNDLDLNDKTKAKKDCENYFGQKNCLKKEITEVCGVETWNMFRDFMLALNENSKQCDFKGII
ncbi:unnamed protein product [Caenorhabditis brenneri]